MTQTRWLDPTGDSFLTASDWSGWVAPRAAKTAPPAVQASASGFTLNVATGQDASGAIQTNGDLADAHWTVTGADNYQNAPTAYTVAPGEADWSPYWLTNGAKSSWIAAAPNAGDNGNMTFTYKFDLTGFDPTQTILAGGAFAADDNGAVYLNGHQLGADTSRNWEVLHPLSNGAGDFVAGVNTLVIQITNADNIDEAARLEGTIVEAEPPSGFNLNVATGQDASGAIQTAGDLADAHWTVSNADSYKNGPIAYTTAPGNADWYFGGGGESAWLANGPGSSWIAANPDSSANGAMTFTLKFDLTGYNPAYATLAGGGLAADDQGAVYLNGHLLGTSARYGWGSLLALSNGAGDFVAGVNTLVIQITLNDNFLEAARLEGTIVDTTLATPPGPIHWASPVSGDFTAPANWTGGFVPGAANDAVLDPAGAAFTVTSTASETVNSIQTAANATLAITGGTFTALAGSGTGANAGAVLVGDGAVFAFAGTLVNTGSLSLGGGGAVTSLIVDGTGATLTGGGAVTLSDNAHNSIAAATSGATLTNIDNTISGAGLLGAGSMGLVNEAAGVIDATGVNPLILETGAIAVVNAGLIEATGAGGLTIQSASIDGSSGGMIAAGIASQVRLQGATLIGGTLRSTGSGSFLVGSGANTLDGTVSAVTNQATVRIADGAALTLQGAVINVGKIGVASRIAGATLIIGSSNATLSGGGRLLLNNSALNRISGATSAATLTNIDNVINGAGQLGAGFMTLNNGARGVIVGSQVAPLVIDTGANTIINAGVILSRGAGGVTIQSAVQNSGLLKADGGALTVNGAVSGAGAGVIYAGTLDFTSNFSQSVVFASATGVLELARSQSYAGAITGFSKSGGTSLDLRDIGFVNSTEATFAGTAGGGVLTVTDGTHTAHITLRGDYRASTFTASSDGHGGTIVIDPTTPAAAHRFVAAAAGLGGGTGGGLASAAHDTWRAQPLMLGRPAAMIA